MPNLARQFLKRIGEVNKHTGTEIALYEPKKQADHHEGYFYVGVIVNEPLTEVPDKMHFITLSQTYVSIRGNMNYINHLYQQLIDWTNEQGYTRDLEALIVEIYHPLTNGQEKVKIYLPIIN